MNQIKVLDKSIYNRIAAGEVVERPLSIVKELVENSIDAGATAISVDIVDGGMKKITISDNGKGIAPDDVPTAFMAHATSKISHIDDLDSICTLGFRGEALPSIAAVSTVKMNTRTNGSQTGYSYTIDNGVVVDSGFCGCPYGTTVIVSDLFEKIPARKKFLSKVSIEESAITSMMSKLILANYKIAIKYSINGKIIYQSHGTDMESAIYVVYGKEFFNGLLSANSEYAGITLSGYICKPSASKHTKSFQTLIVNGRYVKSDDVSFWIYGCYQNYLMKRQFPAYVLYLNLPYDLVDVNVHPNKLEIKFANEGLVKKLITDVVKQQILNNLSTPSYAFEEDVVEILPEVIEDDTVVIKPTESKMDSSVLGEIHTRKIVTNALDFSKLRDSDGKIDPIFSHVSDVSEISVSPQAQKESSDRAQIVEQIIDSVKSSDVATISEVSQNKLSIEKKAVYCGKLFNTYLIFEYDDCAYMVDQHAAHERILYDKLCAQFNSGEVVKQSMLIPYTFSVSPDESSILFESLENLNQLGFEIEKYSGNDFSVKSVPALCANMNIGTFVSDLVLAICKKSEITKAELFKEKLAQTACKSAIKGGDNIHLREISDLVDQMLNQDRVLVCPHGRPIVIKITQKEIEKWFKRIV